MPDQPVLIYKGATAQPFSDQIKINGKPFDLGSGSTVSFMMRFAESDDLKVEASATIDNEDKGIVHYDWEDEDLDERGEYFGWWKVETVDNEIIETDEFLIVIVEHAPGVRARTGAIYRAARGIIPVTWNALESSDKYGDSLLQQKIETTKLKVFGVAVAAENESTYDIRIIDYIAKLVVLQVIPGGADYWASQRQAISATGTNENTIYPDRVGSIWKIYDRLLAEVQTERDEIEELLGHSTLRVSTSIPEVSDGTDEGHITPNPHHNFRDYGFQHNDYGAPRRAVPRRGWL